MSKQQPTQSEVFAIWRGWAARAAQGAPEAQHWLQRFMSEWAPGDVFALGYWVFYGKGDMPHNPALGLELLRAAGERGSLDAQLVLAVSAYFGDLPDRAGEDHVEGAYWFRKAAEQGHAVAQNVIGELYRAGDGVARNFEAALMWFWRAAHQGLAQAYRNLGHMYCWGAGVERDDVQAAQHYRAAAEGGDERAMLALGDLYRVGRGVPRDAVLAYMWYEIPGSYGTPDREDLAQRLTPAQVAWAEALAQQWRKAHAGAIPWLQDEIEARERALADKRQSTLA